MEARNCWGTQYFEVTHETSACWCSHFEATVEFEFEFSLEMMQLFGIAVLMWGCWRGDGLGGVLVVWVVFGGVTGAGDPHASSR